MRSTIHIACLLLLLASALVFGWHFVFPLATRFAEFPRVTLWAWERPEDMRMLDPHLYAIAYLDQTISVTDDVRSTPRMQPIQFAGSAKIVAVVRIEAPSRSARLESPGVSNVVANLVVSSARKPAVSGLQIDFDATQSQRAFYMKLLREVRKQMPSGMPLSVTALASWCGPDSWLKNLPVDEAVPMMFRMGEDPRSSNRRRYPIREPLCSASVGVSTDEPWPYIASTQRVYIFHPRPWDVLAVRNARKLITDESAR